MICLPHSHKSQQLPHWGKITDILCCCAKLFIKYFCYNMANKMGKLFSNPIPNHFQKLATKAPTFDTATAIAALVQNY